MGKNQRDKKKGLEEPEPVGRHFGKRDIHRTGFFDDPVPGPFDFYEPPVLTPREDVAKGKQMLGKPKTGELIDGNFRRIFEGECLNEKEIDIKLMKKLRKKKKKSDEKPPLRPAGTTPKHSAPGDYYGCFGPKLERFDPPAQRLGPTKRKKKAPPNFLTNPGPKGGPGYLKITLNPYIPVQKGPEPYEKIKYRKPKEAGKPVRFKTCARVPSFFSPNPYGPLVRDGQPQYEWSPDLDVDNAEEAQRKKSKETKKRNFYTSWPKSLGGNKDGCLGPFLYMPNAFRAPKKRRKPRKNLVGSGPSRVTKFTGLATANRGVVPEVPICDPKKYVGYRERGCPVPCRPE